MNRETVGTKFIEIHQNSWKNVMELETLSRLVKSDLYFIKGVKKLLDKLLSTWAGVFTKDVKRNTRGNRNGNRKMNKINLYNT